MTNCTSYFTCLRYSCYLVNLKWLAVHKCLSNLQYLLFLFLTKLCYKSGKHISIFKHFVYILCFSNYIDTFSRSSRWVYWGLYNRDNIGFRGIFLFFIYCVCMVIQSSLLNLCIFSYLISVMSSTEVECTEKTSCLMRKQEKKPN
jgi:hypothetical protein